MTTLERRDTVALADGGRTWTAYAEGRQVAQVWEIPARREYESRTWRVMPIRVPARTVICHSLPRAEAVCREFAEVMG